MPPAGAQQAALVGLITGSEVYGLLPIQATGRVEELLNDDSSHMLVMKECTTEDVRGGTPLGELGVVKDHITYVQLWGDVVPGSAGPAPASRARGQEIQMAVLLQTRITISGTAVLPPGLEPVRIFEHPGRPYLEMTRVSLSTPTGETREAAVIYVARSAVLLMWEATS